MRRLLTDELAALHAWGMVLVLSFLALPASAQVAGVCGAGRNCAVAKIRTSTTPANAQICLQNSGTYDHVLGSAASVVALQATQKTCSENTVLNMQSWNSSTGAVSFASSMYGTGALYWSTTQGFAASLAFASFPACAAGTNGRLLFDSTNNVWRTCINGLGWFALQRVTASATMTFAPATGVTVNAPLGAYTAGNGVFGTEAMHAVNALGTVVTAGSGAGSAVYTLYNESSALSLGVTVTCACNAGAGSTCSVAGTPYIITNDSLAISWRLTTDCATARPAVNLSTHISYQSY